MSKLKRLATLAVSICMLATVGFAAACDDDTTHTKHVDANNDGKCDVCGEDMSTPDTDPDPGPDEEDPEITVGTDPDADKKLDSADIILNDGKKYTYNTYTSVSPSNWNELTYQDQNDLQIVNYIMSPFFEFDYEFDANGEIVPGGFNVRYSAARGIEDVTAEYAEEWGLTDEQVDIGGYAWKITLRDDLKWDDGTEIHAEDFVYTMSEQLNPLFYNFRADSFYNSGTMIHNARNYLFQGSVGDYPADTAYINYSEDLDDELIFSLGNGENLPGIEAVCSFRTSMGVPATYTAEQTVQFILANGCGSDFNVAVAAKMEGKTLAQIKADPEMKAAWEALIGWWQTLPNEELDFFVVNDFTWPEMDFDQVGIFVGETENELVLVLDSNINLLEDDGSLTYLAAYQLQSLPLVKKDLYEKCKQEPVAGSTLWTTTYNSSLETTASWGPYKLAQFQPGTSYTLERNTNWYGYSLEKYEGQYKTDSIYCRTLPEWNTAWQAFQRGEIDSISMDVTIADQYRNSSHALFTPSDFVGSMQLQSSAEALKNNETAGVDKEMLIYPEFRKALSLGINRAQFAEETTVSSLAGFGLFNSMHYYDVAHGGVYRNTEPAMRVILDVYGFTENADGTWTDGNRNYGDLIEAYDAVTGYNPTLARELLTEAYNKALAAGTINATDKVVLVYGTAEENESTTRTCNFLNNAVKELAKGTPLEGRIEITIDGHYANTWADEFKNGAYEICLGGWTGAAWDPGYFLLAYLDPNYMYSVAWDTSAEMMTFTMPTVEDWTDEQNEARGLGIELTMSLMDWYYCLNGTGGNYNWSQGVVPDDVRLELIAALEKAILEQYYSVPLDYEFTAELYSYKTEYISTTYNTFMAYGGIQYMDYNYTDDEWTSYLAENTLDYTK